MRSTRKLRTCPSPHSEHGGTTLPPASPHGTYLLSSRLIDSKGGVTREERTANRNIGEVGFQRSGRSAPNSQRRRGADPGLRRRCHADRAYLVSHDSHSKWREADQCNSST